MSQHHAVLIDELWNETERLQARVAQLQAQLAQVETQRETETPNKDEDVWNVWPYSWAQSGWSFANSFLSNRFHSFHEKRLMHKNRKSQRAFWQTPHPEDIEMKLV